MGVNSRPTSRNGGTPRPNERPTDVRTPIAWQFRERKPSPNFRRLSSGSTSSGESSSEAEFQHLGGRPKRGPLSFLGYSQAPYYRSGTLRSSRSMPGIPLGATWDGRPCPVHGSGHPHPPHPPFPPSHPYPVPFPPPGGAPIRKAGSMFDLRGASPAPSFYSVIRPMPPPSPLPGNAIYTTLPPPPVDNRSHYGSLRSLRSNKSLKSVMISPIPPPPSLIGIPPPTHVSPHYPLPPMPPPYLLPPGAQPRPFVIPAGAEPLPVRDPNKSKGAPPLMHHNKAMGEKKGYACCRGPMPFVWFVVILVSVGVILGIILGATLG